MDLPEGYMEPVLDVIMPKRQVKLTHKTALESRKRHLEDHPSADRDMMYLLYSGSAEEGLYLPDLSLVRKPVLGSEPAMLCADQDVMIVWGSLPVNQEVRRKTFATMEVNEVNPGYCRLRYNSSFPTSFRTEPALPIKLNVSDVLQALDKDGYISNTKFVDAMSKTLELRKHAPSIFQISERPGYNLQTSHTQHGPALTSRIVCSGGNDLRVDNVHSFHCKEWPGVASEWVHRERPSGWPSQHQIRDIVKHGCHVVPVPHPRSQRPNIEWRLSFSEAEVKLALSLSTVPRRCYIFLKLLHIYRFKRLGSALVSYFMKTALFWLCEQISLSEWREMKTVEGIRQLLQFLLKSCEDHALPNYFVPQNNMFSGLGVVQVLKTKETIREVLENPVQHLVDLTKFYHASHMPADPLIYDIVGRCLTRFPRPESEEDVNRFQNCLRGHIINGLLTQGDSTYEGIAEVTVCTDVEKLPSAKDCLTAFERVIEIESDLGGIELKLQLAVVASTYHNLGRLALLENNQKAHNDFCVKAKTLFEELLGPSDLIDIRQIWMFVEYCNLLRNLGEYVTVLRIVYAVIKAQLNRRYPNVYNTYANHNSHTADEYFSWEVEHYGTVSVLSFGNLMYLAACCHLDRGKELRRSRHTGQKGAQFFVDCLEEFVRDKCNRFAAVGDETSIAILGYLMFEMDEYDEAIRVFNWVLELDPNSIHAMVYRDLAVDEINKKTRLFDSRGGAVVKPGFDSSVVPYAS